MLNELNKEEVYNYIYKWIRKTLNKWLVKKSIFLKLNFLKM